MTGRKMLPALLMSLNMLIESSGGYDMTFEELDALFREAGFIDTYVIPLAGNASAAVAVK